MGTNRLILLEWQMYWSVKTVDRNQDHPGRYLDFYIQPVSPGYLKIKKPIQRALQRKDIPHLGRNSVAPCILDENEQGVLKL